MTLTEIDKQLKENPERLYRMYYFLMEIKKAEARKFARLKDEQTISGAKDIVRIEPKEVKKDGKDV